MKMSQNEETGEIIFMILGNLGCEELDTKIKLL